MNFTEIKTNDKGIAFKSDSETRSMKKDDASANVTFIIKPFVSFDKALKSALDFAIIRFRDAEVKKAKTAKMTDADWMKLFDGKTIELDIDSILTANGRESDPVRKVANAIGKANIETMVTAMVRKGIDEKSARAAIAAFIS